MKFKDWKELWDKREGERVLVVVCPNCGGMARAAHTDEEWLELLDSKEVIRFTCKKCGDDYAKTHTDQQRAGLRKRILDPDALEWRLPQK